MSIVALGVLPPQNFVRLYEIGQYEFVITFNGMMLVPNFMLKNRLAIRSIQMDGDLKGHIVQRMLNALCRSRTARSRLLWMHKD
jgi:hypothetical protein